jgi:hypothetical protein
MVLRTSGTLFDNMALLFAIIAELLSTIVSNVSIFFAAITLYIAHIPTLSFSLSYKSNCN